MSKPKICPILLDEILQDESTEIVTQFGCEIELSNVFVNTQIKFDECVNDAKFNNRLTMQRFLDKDNAEYKHVFLINTEWVLLIEVEKFRYYIRQGTAKTLFKYFNIHVPRSGWFKLFREHIKPESLSSRISTR